VPNVDYIYWTFTAAAQSVAAFVGLLLAGYALVHSLMEAARERDETLDEIHGALRMRFHRWLTLLATLTCLAIVLSLVVVFTNKWEFPGKYLLAGLVGIIDIASIVCGLAFVVLTSHPSRYTFTAERVLAQRKPDLALSGEAVPVGKFFAVIARLERAMRKALQAGDIELAPNPNGRSASIRQLADALLQNERIDADLHRELLVIGQYRNLVHHGHVTTADKTMLDRVLLVLKRVAAGPTLAAVA
jgi:hypothetical protein